MEALMNYYEHHIGDYDEATAHLTACEDGIYSRLIRKYYSTEKALPNDIPALQRLVRARSRDEKAAVKTILEEFFDLREDGWHQKRCDEDLARYLDKKRKAQASANARWTNREPQSERNANASNSGVRTDSERNANAYANASQTHDERNAHQAPDTSSHTPNTKDKTEGTNERSGPPIARARPAEISAAMRRNGIEAQPADPRIIAASEAGFAVETIEAACAEAKASKPNERISPLYVLRIVERWTAEAASPRPVRSTSQDRVRAQNEARMQAFVNGGAPADPMTIDMEQ
jgi:uncharacterized protein YdaU (DUF1376 family)